MIKNIILNNSNNEPLSIDFRYPDSNNKGIPILIFCHGFKGFKDWGCFPYMLDSISNEGIFCVSFNFSRNGTDNTQPNPTEFTRLDLFAKNTFSTELDDLNFVLDYLESEKEYYGYDFDSLTLAGHSRGGGISIIKAATDNRIKKLITLASVASFDRYGNETRKRWKEDGFIEVLNTRTKQKMRLNYTLLEDVEKNHKKLDILEAMSEIKIPVLIVHGKEDLAVDYSEAEALYSICPSATKTLELFENTGHTFGAVHPFEGTTEYLEKVISAIKKFL